MVNRQISLHSHSRRPSPRRSFFTAPAALLRALRTVTSGPNPAVRSTARSRQLLPFDFSPTIPYRFLGERSMNLAKNTLIALSYASFAAFFPAKATDTFTARSLISLCDPAPNQPEADLQAAKDACDVYIRGFTDGLFMMQEFQTNSMKPCFPPNQPVSDQAAKQLFSAYLRRRPSAADNSAGLVLGMALHDAFPCGAAK